MFSKAPAVLSDEASASDRERGCVKLSQRPHKAAMARVTPFDAGFTRRPVISTTCGICSEE